MEQRVHKALMDVLACRPNDINSISLAGTIPEVLLREDAFKRQFPGAEPREWTAADGGTVLFYEAYLDGILYSWNERKEDAA